MNANFEINYQRISNISTMLIQYIYYTLEKSLNQQQQTKLTSDALLF